MILPQEIMDGCIAIDDLPKLTVEELEDFAKIMEAMRNNYKTKGMGTNKK